MLAAALLIVGAGVLGAVLALKRAHHHAKPRAVATVPATTVAQSTARAVSPTTTEASVPRPASAQLTQWRRIAYSANPLSTATVYAAPRARGRAVTKLHLKTEDGFPEVYLVFREVVTKSGSTWLKIGLPMRPNGTTGWVQRGALGSLHPVTTWLVVDQRALRITLFDQGRKAWSAPVGVGKPSTPTPNGLFWVREEFVLQNQVFYGPYAFGTSAYASISDWPGGGVVGLHGTSLPQLIPGRPSHGCVRLRNADILWLARHVPVGTPVSIVN